jgi:glucuronokinase
MVLVNKSGAPSANSSREGRGMIVANCPARAALAGNPSDGYGGFVVAVPVLSARATVSISPAARFEIVPSPTSDDTFDDLSALVAHVDRFGTDDARRLVLATVRALVRRTGATIDPVRIDVSTTIPRSVGLAGSSAIVIATLRGLIALNAEADWAAKLGSDPEELAHLALSVERDELGIGAGLQDRLVQSLGAPVAMNFAQATPTVRVLGPVPGRLLVAYRLESAEPGGALHNRLRSDFDQDVGATRSTMAAVAAQGELAASAIDIGDVGALGSAMDRTLELRAQLLPLDQAMCNAAAAVRDHGGYANWTGSGGAIVALLPDSVDVETLRSSLQIAHGCHLIDL